MIIVQVWRLGRLYVPIFTGIFISLEPCGLQVSLYVTFLAEIGLVKSNNDDDGRG